MLTSTFTSSRQESIINPPPPQSLLKIIRIIFNSCKNTQKKSGRVPPMNTNCVCHTSYKEAVHLFMWSCYCAARDPCENVMVARLWIRCQHEGLQLLEGRRGADRCWWMNREWVCWREYLDTHRLFAFTVMWHAFLHYSTALVWLTAF